MLVSMNKAFSQWHLPDLVIVSNIGSERRISSACLDHHLYPESKRIQTESAD